MAKFLLFSVTLTSLLSLSFSIPSQTILNAAEVLSDAGFVSMSLTLQLVPPTLILLSPSATLFAPPDSAFARSGQPPLSTLQFHFLRLTFSPQSLRSLAYGTKIPTMFAGHSLTVTSHKSDRQISLNNVTISPAPLFDDGSLIIYSIEKFFDPQFQPPAVVQRPPTPYGCRAPVDQSAFGSFSFDEASEVLRSRGHSVMASFLDLQLGNFRDQTELTVFAPFDEVMLDAVGNFSEYSSLFLPHVLSCKLTLSDLLYLDDGTSLETSLEGFTINVTKSGDLLMLNDVPVTFPDMYSNSWLVVHGLRDILMVPERPEQAADLSQNGENSKEENVSDRGEF